MNWKSILCGSMGLIFIAIGIILPLIFPMIFEAKLNEKLIISPGAPVLKTFSKTPIPIYFQIYFFNVTNSVGVLDESEKPILQELGPYTYRQERIKHNITWNHELGTVFYQEQKFYYFEPEMSSGSEEDVIITLNPVYVALAAKSAGMSVVQQTFISMLPWNYDFEPFLAKKAGELTFKGYDDEVVQALYRQTKEARMKPGKAGYFFGKNGSIDDGIEIMSGEAGMHNYQHIYKWHGKTELDFWEFPKNNMLNGTTGSQFARPIDTTKPLYIYTSDLCRSIYLTYEKDVQHGPLTLHRFSITADVLDNSPENMGFCSDELTCRKSMLDITKCRNGAPIVMSTPHFYLGDEADLEMVEGLNPSKEKHETYLDIEPNTGVAMRASKGMQVNMAFKHSETLTDMNYVDPLIFPVLWVNENAVVPLDRAEALHQTLEGPKATVYYLAGGLILIGAILLITGVVLHCCTSKKKNISGKRQTNSDKTPQDVNFGLVEKNGAGKA